MWGGDSSECVGDSGECVGDSSECVGDSGECVGDSGECVGNSGMCVSDSSECEGYRVTRNIGGHFIWQIGGLGLIKNRQHNIRQYVPYKTDFPAVGVS